MTWLVIVNPAAGRHGSPIDEISSGLDVRGVDAVVKETTSLDDLRSTVEDAVDRGVDHFVAVGGDGTAHHIVDAALTRRGAGSPITLAVIPAGSGSDFVRTFGRSGEPIATGLDRLVEPERYPIDVGMISGASGTTYFLNAANAGVAAASAATASRLPRRLGSGKYTIGFWLTLGRFRPAAIDVLIDRHHFAGRAINVVVANGQFFGGGLNIAPRASMVDGILDVQVFSGPRRNAFVIMPRLLFGSHLTHTAVRRYLGANVTITCPDGWPIEADGELLGTGDVTISVIRGAVDFVV